MRTLSAARPFTLRAEALLTALSLVCSLGLFTFLSMDYWHYAELLEKQRIPFDTDEADHANAGLELFRALTTEKSVAEAVLRQAFYPPVHSIAVAVSYFIYGPTLEGSRIPSLVFWALTTLVLFLLISWSFRLASPGLKIPLWPQLLGASLGAYLFASSRIVIVNSLLCMLELCSLFLLSLLLLAIQRNSRGGILLFSILVFLSKYSVGIVVLPGAFLAYLFTKGLIQSLKLFLPIGAALLAWIFLSDPYAFWRFIVGHPSYAPIFSEANLLFYPKAWLTHYSPSSAVGVASIVFATCGAVLFWKQMTVKAAVAISLLSLLALTLSTTNEVRHIIVVLPCVYFLCGMGVAGLSLRASKYLSPTPLFIILGGLGAFLISTVNTDHEVLPRQIKRAFEGHHSYSRFHSLIADKIDPTKPTLACGLFDQFGREAIAWSVAAAHTNLGYTDVKLDTYPFTEARYQRLLERKRNVDHPYIETEFPRAPLSNVLAQDYYKHAILFRRIKNPKNSECLKELAKYPKVARAYGDWTVSVFDLTSTLEVK